MAIISKWHDDYWLMLMQLYISKPAGMKPLYSRPLVDLALELHIPPLVLQDRLRQIDKLTTPRIERIWRTYAKKPEKLARAVRLLRSMKGFGDANAFYDGVEINETWEKDWQPLDQDGQFTVVTLILILDLYFQLAPLTMVSNTPEVKELARLTGISADKVVEVLEVFQHCDPYLARRDVTFSPLLLPCQNVWQRYAGDLEALTAYATQLKDYFKPTFTRSPASIK